VRRHVHQFRHIEQSSGDTRSVIGSSLVAFTPSVIAGCNDGSVVLFDVRMPANESRITTLRHLQMPVVNVHLLQSDSKVRLVAGSVDGHVRVWEPRMYQVGRLFLSAQLSSHPICVPSALKCPDWRLTKAQKIDL
jgi:WD40 repeat protein